MTILYILLVPFAILCVGAIIIAIVDYFKQKKRNSKEELIKEVRERLESFITYEVSKQLTSDPKALQKSYNLRKRFNTARFV